jgi:hypothetical protein
MDKSRAVPYLQVQKEAAKAVSAPVPQIEKATQPTTKGKRGRKAKESPSDWRQDSRVNDILAKFIVKGDIHWEMYQLGYPVRVIAEVTGANTNTIAVDISRRKKKV